MTAQDWELGRLFSFVDILAKLVAKSYTGDSNSQESHKNANHRITTVGESSRIIAVFIKIGCIEKKKILKQDVLKEDHILISHLII